MRNLVDVIDEMIKDTPSTEMALMVDLNSIKGFVSYASPETQSFWWNECAEVLMEHVPEITESWHKDIATIFNG